MLFHSCFDIGLACGTMRQTALHDWGAQHIFYNNNNNNKFDLYSAHTQGHLTKRNKNLNKE